MKLRNVVVMLVLAIIAVLVMVVMQDEGSGKPAWPATMPEFAKDEVTKLSVLSEGRSLVFRRRTDRTDAWELEEGTTLIRADAAAVDDVLGALLRQEVRTKFEQKELTPGDLTGYGLDTPSFSVEFQAGPDLKVVRYGKKTREGTGIYVDTGPGTDVWVVGSGVADVVTSLATNGARSKRLTDLRLYDLSTVTVSAGGVSKLDASRDPSGIWRISQPFTGFGDPQEFERFLNRLLNTDVAWVEAGAQDLAKYGLVTPFAEIRLTPRRAETPPVDLIVGNRDGDGVLAMEKGRPNVGRLSGRFLEAVRAAIETPLSLRDRAFTRLGFGVVRLKVRFGDQTYELAREGNAWEVTRPEPRHPCDDASVRSMVEKLQGWRTVEWVDGAKPADHGIREGGDFVEAVVDGGGTTTILLGDSAADASRFAVRRSPEGESGVERVEGAILELLTKGYPQFMARTVRSFGTFLGDLKAVSRDAGSSDEGEKVQTIVIERDPAGTKGWEISTTRGPGVPGTLDAAAINRLVARLDTVTAVEWVVWDPSKNEAMGLVPGGAKTCTIGLTFSGRTGLPPKGAEQTLLIGARRPEGGYFARFHGAEESWAFVMSSEDAKAFMEPLTKQ